MSSPAKPSDTQPTQNQDKGRDSFEDNPKQTAPETSGFITRGEGVALVAPRDALADDAIERLSHRHPGIITARSYGYVTDLVTILGKEATNQHARSVSSLALGLVEKDPITWAIIKQARNDRINNRAAWLENKAKYIGKARYLIEVALSTVGVVCGTPEALRQFLDYAQWEPHMVIVDDADKMSESMILAVNAMTKDNKPCIVFGDFQLGSVTPDLNLNSQDE